jgi:demethylmenaquinone methyltransferase/2-methoxy-6-polyprenyl-1,4-benzoquinol methylase
MYRLLRPGGQIGILEFSDPKGFFGSVYRFYSQRLLPRIGGLISGDPGAYAYLPESISRFPLPEELAARMRDAGFGAVRYHSLTLGTVHLHVAERRMV